MPVHQPHHEPEGNRAPTVPEAVRRRAAGRRRVGAVTRWTLAAAAAGAAVLGAGYAHWIPGVQAQSPPGAPASTRPGGSGGLQPPSSAPGTTQQAPHTQSGAS